MYEILDLFSGCGGLSEGFLQAGLKIAASVEIDSAACATQRLNHPETHVIEGDLTKLSPEDVSNITGIATFDVIIGGPPCQGFSLIGTRLGTNKSLGKFIEDPRNRLYKEFVKYVRYFQPKLFLMENVPGLFSMHGGKVKESVENDFTEDDADGKYIGYNVKSEIVRAVEFGVPQNRERVIFIGVRKDINIDFRMPQGVFNDESQFCVRDAIGDLPPLDVKDGKDEIYYDAPKNAYLKLLNTNASKIKRSNGYKKNHIYNHTSRYSNDRDREIFRILKPFQVLKDLDPQLVPIRLRNGFDDFYRKMDYQKPAPTIIAHLYKDGLAFIHPDSSQARTISIREAARLQSFPDSFVFPGSQSVKFKQIGNAVPPLLAYHLAEHIKSILKNIDEFQATDHQ